MACQPVSQLPFTLKLTPGPAPLQAPCCATTAVIAHCLRFRMPSSMMNCLCLLRTSLPFSLPYGQSFCSPLRSQMVGPTFMRSKCVCWALFIVDGCIHLGPTEGEILATLRIVRAACGREQRPVHRQVAQMRRRKAAARDVLEPLLSCRVGWRRTWICPAPFFLVYVASRQVLQGGSALFRVLVAGFYQQEAALLQCLQVTGVFLRN